MNSEHIKSTNLIPLRLLHGTKTLVLTTNITITNTSRPTDSNLQIPPNIKSLKNLTITLRRRPRHIVEEAIRALAMHRIVTDQHIGLAHT